MYSESCLQTLVKLFIDCTTKRVSILCAESYRLARCCFTATGMYPSLTCIVRFWVCRQPAVLMTMTS